MRLMQTFIEYEKRGQRLRTYHIVSDIIVDEIERAFSSMKNNEESKEDETIIEAIKAICKKSNQCLLKEITHG